MSSYPSPSLLWYFLYVIILWLSFLLSLPYCSTPQSSSAFLFSSCLGLFVCLFVFKPFSASKILCGSLHQPRASEMWIFLIPYQNCDASTYLKFKYNYTKLWHICHSPHPVPAMNQGSLSPSPSEHCLD